VDVSIPDRVDITLDDSFERFMDVRISRDSIRVISAEVIYSVRWHPMFPEGTACAFEKGSYAIPYTEGI
jgi:hypothetical protein